MCGCLRALAVSVYECLKNGRHVHHSHLKSSTPQTPPPPLAPTQPRQKIDSLSSSLFSQKDLWEAGGSGRRGAGRWGPPLLVTFDPHHLPHPALWTATALCLTGGWLNRAALAVRQEKLPCGTELVLTAWESCQRIEYVYAHIHIHTHKYWNTQTDIVSISKPLY